MAQIKIYGHSSFLAASGAAISDLVHGCTVEAFGLPAEKRFHRLLGLEPDAFFTPPDRSERYLIIEVIMFSGRSVETKKDFYRLLYERAASELGIEPTDLEIVILETPRHDWGIRGRAGDELDLSYRVDV